MKTSPVLLSLLSTAAAGSRDLRRTGRRLFRRHESSNLSLSNDDPAMPALSNAKMAAYDSFQDDQYPDADGFVFIPAPAITESTLEPSPEPNRRTTNLDISSAMAQSRMSPTLSKLRGSSTDAAEFSSDADSLSPTASPIEPTTLSFLPENAKRSEEDESASIDFITPVDSDTASIFAIVFLVVTVCGSAVALTFIAALVRAKNGAQSSVGETAVWSDGEKSTGVPSTIEITLTTSDEDDISEIGLPSPDHANHLVMAKEDHASMRRIGALEPTLIADMLIFRSSCKGSSLERVPEETSVDYGSEEGSI